MAAKIIGITGGIGSGKTTICRELQARGVFVYESDKESHRVMNSDRNVISALKELFGDEIFVGGQLDRKQVAAQVFANKELLAQMNNIVHPAVKTDFQQWTLNFPQEKYLFIESAILFESGFNVLCDASVLVIAPLDVRIARAMVRDNVSSQAVNSRINSQRPTEELLALSDIVINNDGKTAIAILVDELLGKMSAKFIP